jgi:hypothetical protein
MVAMPLNSRAFHPVPGMAHYGGGPATDRFDLFSVLVDWVEHGRAPATVTVRADHGELPQGWSPAATLRLAEGRALSRRRRPRIGCELPLRIIPRTVIVITIAASVPEAVLTRGQ